MVDEVVAEDLVTHGQGDDLGSQGVEAFEDWLRWYLAKVMQQPGALTVPGE